MSLNISNLQPNLLWKFFEEICNIPHGSKNELQLVAYLENFAKTLNLAFKTDKAGNVLISKKGTPGYENKPAIVLQSHLDMVCEKNVTSTHNFLTDPIQPYIDGAWVKAKDTTLGADDGIGVAAQLALLHATDIEHGPIECLFTVDEETGLTGAFGLEPNFFEGKTLLNLDSEDEGLVFIGCAGGMDTTGKLQVKMQSLPQPVPSFSISIGGLLGGHSGDDINKGLGNAIKIASRLALQLLRSADFALVNFQGGNLRNAIAREAKLDFACINSNVETAKVILQSLVNEIIIEFSTTEKNIKIDITEATPTDKILDSASAFQLIKLITALPHGVISMSHSVPGLVETSTNLASVKRIDETTFEIATSQRSDVDSLKQNIANHVAATFRLAGAVAQHSVGYPGWKPNPDSAILQKATTTYTQLFNQQLTVGAIHAGLECGLFLEKYPNLDMISFGPTIKGAHSPDERLDIESVVKFWNFLVRLLK